MNTLPETYNLQIIGTLHPVPVASGGEQKPSILISQGFTHFKKALVEFFNTEMEMLDADIVRSRQLPSHYSSIAVNDPHGHTLLHARSIDASHYKGTLGPGIYLELGMPKRALEHALGHPLLLYHDDCHPGRLQLMLRHNGNGQPQLQATTGFTRLLYQVGYNHQTQPHRRYTPKGRYPPPWEGKGKTF